MNGMGETYGIEFTSVVITVENANLTAENAGVTTDGEVIWHEWASIWLQYDLTFQEGTLWSTRVDLFRLGDHDGLVFQVVENCHFPNLGIFETTLNDVFFKETVESQDLE